MFHKKIFRKATVGWPAIYLLEIGCFMQKVCTLVATAGQPRIGRQPTIQKCLAGYQMPTRIALHETKKMKPVLVGLSPKISIKEQGTNDIFDRINHRDCTNKKGASATKTVFIADPLKHPPVPLHQPSNTEVISKDNWLDGIHALYSGQSSSAKEVNFMRMAPVSESTLQKVCA